ncbi:hypothetical protein EJB05_50002, partial [Eragrostis curvula]
MSGDAEAPATPGGKFWSEDSESESEVEDLGFTDPVPEPVRQSSLQEVQLVERGWQKVQKRIRRKKEHVRPSEVPQRKPWRGPLPKPRFSPKQSIGDVIGRAMEQRHAGGSSPAARRSRGHHDPKPARSCIQILNPLPDWPCRLRAGPILKGHTHQGKETRRTQPSTSNKQNLDPQSRRPTYLQAMMAGGGVKGATSGGAGGDGGGEKRRSYVQGYRGNWFKAGRGRGCRSPSPPGQDRVGDLARGGRAHEAIGRGGRGSHNGRGRGRGNRDGSPYANPGRGVDRDAPHRGDDRVARMEEEKPQQADKHRSSELAGENAKKKKKFQLQCTICLEEHHTSKCGLLFGPKPSTTCCGFGAKGEVFFQIPYDKAAPIPKKVTATALVTIVEGEVSAKLVKAELARLILVKWDWVVRPHGNNKYLVTLHHVLLLPTVKCGERGL